MPGNTPSAALKTAGRHDCSEARGDLKAEASRSSLRRHGLLLPPAWRADFNGPVQREEANRVKFHFTRSWGLNNIQPGYQ